MKPNIDEVAMLYLVKSDTKSRPTALIVVDEYCPYCERLIKDTLALIKAGKTPKYDLAVAFFPVHRKAVDASCKLMGVGKDRAREIYLKWVESKDPKIWATLKCDPEKRKEFLAKAVMLRMMAGINATPTVILPNGRKIVGYKNPEEFLF